MKNFILFISILLVNSFSVFSQNKIQEVKGEAVVEWNMNSESKDLAKSRALQLAKDNAIETTFGTAIIRNVVSSVEVKNNNGKAESSENMQMQSSSIVKGEIINILSEKYEDIVESGKGKTKKYYIKCKIKVQVRELENLKVANEIIILSDIEIIKPNEEFKSGEDLFFYYKSAESGYLSIFLDDGNNAARLLPYSQMPKQFENGVSIDANKEYILFTEKHRYFGEKDFAVDELVLFTSNPKMELNTLYFIFSKKPLNKPVLKNQGSNINISEIELELPAIMTSTEFQKWRVQNMAIRSDMQIEQIVITIRP